MVYIGVIVDTLEKKFQRKAKFTLEQVTKTQRGSIGIALLFL
jgi:hypothetical protein